MKKDVLLLDACIVINLEATRVFDSIAQVLDMRFWVVRQASIEVGRLRDDINGEIVATAIDLQPRISAGSIVIVDLEPAEIPLYVDLASEVDDGEAASIAVAHSRHVDLATDDRKARRICAERGMAEPIRTTELVKSYCEALSLSAREIETILRLIRARASFIPPRADPNFKWWSDHVAP